jgi:hypothetical protein
MLLENYQVINENGAKRFAVIDFAEFSEVRELLTNTEKLEEYLDYLHMQKIKMKNEKMYSLDEAKQLLDE